MRTVKKVYAHLMSASKVAFSSLSVHPSSSHPSITIQWLRADERLKATAADCARGINHRLLADRFAAQWSHFATSPPTSGTENRFPHHSFVHPPATLFSMECFIFDAQEGVTEGLFWARQMIFNKAKVSFNLKINKSKLWLRSTNKIDLRVLINDWLVERQPASLEFEILSVFIYLLTYFFLYCLDSFLWKLTRCYYEALVTCGYICRVGRERVND